MLIFGGFILDSPWSKKAFIFTMWFYVSKILRAVNVSKVSFRLNFELTQIVNILFVLDNYKKKTFQ